MTRAKNSITRLPYPQTPETARAYINAHVLSIVQLARANGIPREAIQYQLDLNDMERIGKRGYAHQAAVVLGYRPAMPDVAPTTDPIASPDEAPTTDPIAALVMLAQRLAQESCSKGAGAGKRVNVTLHLTIDDASTGKHLAGS